MQISKQSVHLFKLRLPIHFLVGSSPNLEPFPTIFKNEIDLCSGLQNVVALEVTPKGHLWVADSGSVAIFTRPRRKCPAKLMVFDLEAGNAEIFSYEFPESVVPTKRNSVLMHMVLDYSKRSEDIDGLDYHPNDILHGLFVYLSEIHSGHLVVFDAQSRSSWTVLVPAMKPTHVTLKFQDQNVNMRFGTTGIALESKAESVSWFQH